MKAIKAKQERYVKQMLALRRIIEQWHSKKVSKHEAMSLFVELGEIHIYQNWSFKELHSLEFP